MTSPYIGGTWPLTRSFPPNHSVRTCTQWKLMHFTALVVGWMFLGFRLIAFCASHQCVTIQLSINLFRWNALIYSSKLCTFRLTFHYHMKYVNLEVPVNWPIASRRCRLKMSGRNLENLSACSPRIFSMSSARSSSQSTFKRSFWSFCSKRFRCTGVL